MPRKQNNPAKILQALIEIGPSSKWNLKEKTSLPYPRVQESINILKKNNSIRIVGTKTSKKNLKMKIYGLSFKGVIEHLASIQIKQPQAILNTGETTGEIAKRLTVEYSAFFKEVIKLHDLLKKYGKDFNFPIFMEINWLSENYGSLVYDLILEISRIVHSSGAPYQFAQALKGQEVEQKKLKQTLKTIERYPSLEKTIMITDKGEGNKETREIDVRSETTNRLNQLTELTPLFQGGENEFLMNSFACTFLERLAYIGRKDGTENKILESFAQDLLEKRKLEAIIPLEKVVRAFGLRKTV